MRNLKFCKFGLHFYISIETNKPKWLVAILFPFYWRYLPWKDSVAPYDA